MKIVFLDKKTIGEDISLEKIESLGDLVCYETTEPTEVIERVRDAEVIITNKVMITEETMIAAENLKLICAAATGYNHIDIDYAAEHNIVVSNVKAYSTESVAQMVFTYILKLFIPLDNYNNISKNNIWSKSPIFTVFEKPVYELTNHKLGIIGYGSIGKTVAEIGKAFGMDILVAKRPGADYDDDFRYDFDYVIRYSDIITIHTPLSDETRNLITDDEFKIMKKSAIIINTARGGIINEDALYKALKSGEITAAAIDVMENEPPKEDNKLFELDNIIITPHIAWASFEARNRLVEGIERNIKNFKEGNIEVVTI